MNWPNFNMITRLMDDVSDSLHSPKLRRAFNSALDLLKPYVNSLGLRITQLSKTQAEVLLPGKMRNLNEQGEMQEAAVIAAGSHLYNLLWNENKPQGDFRLQILTLRLQKQSPWRGDLRLRWELGQLQRETIYAELAAQKKTQQEVLLSVFNNHDMLVGQIEISAEIYLTEMLEWK